MGRNSLASFFICPKKQCKGTEVIVYTIIEKGASFVNGIKVGKEPKWKTVGSRTRCQKCGFEQLK